MPNDEFIDKLLFKKQEEELGGRTTRLLMLRDET